MTASPKVTAMAGLIAAQFALGACATAAPTAGPRSNGPKNASPVLARADAAPGPRLKTDRSKIGRQDILTQMTFWANEVALHPEDNDAALKFSEVLRKGGRPDRAAEVARQALDRSPQDRKLMRAYGLSLLAAGKSFEAMRPLAMLAQADAKDYKARSALGVALDEQGRYEEARQAYREALDIKADDASVLTNMGVSYLLTGDAAKAEEILRQAAALKGATPETRQNLALAVGLQGRFAEAEQLQKVDLPPALVENNMAYLRGLLSDDRRWSDVKKR